MPTGTLMQLSLLSHTKNVNVNVMKYSVVGQRVPVPAGCYVAPRRAGLARGFALLAGARADAGRSSLREQGAACPCAYGGNHRRGQRQGDRAGA